MAKQPWLAVFLSFLLPGAGQLYGGKSSRGIFFITITFILYGLGVSFLYFFLSSDDAALSRSFGMWSIISWVVLFTIGIYSLFDAYKTARQFNADHHVETEPFQKKNPWFALFLSKILPGLGQLYNRQWLKVLLFIIGLIIISVTVQFHYLFSLLFLPLSLSALIDAFDSAARMNGSEQRLSDQVSTGIKVFVVAVILFEAVPLGDFIRAHFIQAYTMPSGSMLPTLAIGDHIYINKEIQGKGPVRRGDVIVFVYPLDRSKDYIKRVIAGGGDTVEIRDKRIFLNGSPCDDPYGVYKDKNIFPASIMSRDNFGPVIVPANAVFVLGDNRDWSNDSRFWGFVDLKDIRGKAIKIYWSWDSDNGSVRWDRIGMMIR
jgi:signal peptidase I